MKEKYLDIRTLHKKVREIEEQCLPGPIDDPANNRDAVKISHDLLKLTHYYHLLQILGDESIDKLRYEATWREARLKLVTIIADKEKTKETVVAGLLDEHTRAWNMVQYYYERATKTLCQMMITIMDYILKKKNNISVLYKDVNREGYFSLIEEMSSLSEEYKDSYYFLCSYDYCTQKIAKYTGITEYKKLYPEHLRILANGIPDKVMTAIDTLKEMSDENELNSIDEIYNIYEKAPEWDKNIADICYNNAIEEYGRETYAMNLFSRLVIKHNSLYENAIKEKL